ncbi:MAG: hypothetical protein R3D69_06390 [Xanthobacteraceae bacterium]
MTVLIIACPCARAYADVDHGRRRSRRARLGILVRDAEALQRLETVDTGDRQDRHAGRKRKKVVAIEAAPDFVEADVPGGWPPASSAAAEHPLAHAMVAAAKDKGVALSQTGSDPACSARVRAARWSSIR